MNKLKKLADTLLNLKPVIIAAIITAATSVVLAIFSTGNVTRELEANELPPAVIKTLPDEETINRLRTELSRSVSATALHDLSDTYFSKNAGPAAIKDSIRMLINYANAHLADREHYTYRMYRLKKIMLNNPRRNINARIDGTNPEAFMLIQQLLQGIEYYKGPIDGDRLKTYLAVRQFQEVMNSYTPGYFNPDNYGIFGNASLMAVMDIL
jgi:hypothetical protein